MAGFISEWWPASNRNGGRNEIGIPGRLASEFAFGIAEAVAEAFPGSRLEIFQQSGRLEIGLQTGNLNRPLHASELSDGTLRYLCLVGAFLGLRMPSFVVLNEPEMSLHPDLLKPLARLIHKGSQRTQVWVITHSELLTKYIEEYGAAQTLHVSMKDGMTIVSEADEMLCPSE
ncbi:AAA family ATPase [Methylocystis sp.]|uniref:AAA family ATPase n=1 Tax=Methylocystis sp. TaxID=1911079 RepID=UPI003DA54BB9